MFLRRRDYIYFYIIIYQKICKKIIIPKVRIFGLYIYIIPKMRTFGTK